MLKVLLYGLLIWFLYNLVFRFVIPIYKTTRQMKKKFREMQTRMQDQMDQQQNFSSQTAQAQTGERSAAKNPKEDYIDFEEIK